MSRPTIAIRFTYGASQMHEQIVQQALLLVEVMDNDAPPPSVVPLSDGNWKLIVNSN